MPILGLFSPARAAGAAIGYLNLPVVNDFSRSCSRWLHPSGVALADVSLHFRVMFRPNNTAVVVTFSRSSSNRSGYASGKNKACADAHLLDNQKSRDEIRRPKCRGSGLLRRRVEKRSVRRLGKSVLANRRWYTVDRARFLLGSARRPNPRLAHPDKSVIWP